VPVHHERTVHGCVGEALSHASQGTAASHVNGACRPPPLFKPGAILLQRQVMVAYAIRTDAGKDLNARFEIDRSEIILYSRGGSKGKNETNPDYAKTLRLLLHRLSDNSMTIRGAWVDSSRVQDLPLSERAILSEDDLGAPPEELFTRMATRMQKVGRAKDAVGHGNATKRIRLQLQEDVPAARIAHALGAIASSIDLRSQQRLPADDLNKVTAEHIWNAIQLLQGGHTDHVFGESTDFDLVADDGTRLPPKAVRAGSDSTRTIRPKGKPQPSRNCAALRRPHRSCSSIAISSSRSLSAQPMGKLCMVALIGPLVYRPADGTMWLCARFDGAELGRVPSMVRNRPHVNLVELPVWSSGP
jgi:hypothetical protein